MSCRRTLALLTVLSAFVCAPVLAAQNDKPQTPAEAELSKNATKILTKFASFARSKKLAPMERQAYGLILSDYDPDHARSRKALDFKKVKGEWELAPPKKRRNWEDKANRKGRFQVQQEWRNTCAKLASEHRELGLAMTDDQGQVTASGKWHLEQAILYDPLDKAAHEALGHQPWENLGVSYYGTAEEVAFMKRMKEIETTALMLAQKEYKVEPIDELPPALDVLGLEMYGAKSEHFTLFTRGTQENADNLCQWGERALEFLDFVTGDMAKTEGRRARRIMKNFGYMGFLWTDLEMDVFKESNPNLVPNRKAKFYNINFRDKKNRLCQVVTRLTPAQMDDHIIAEVFHYGLGGSEVNNVGLVEGIHHAATWFLKSTCITKFGAEPKGTATENKLVLPEGANWWMREMRNQSISKTDTPLNVVPRVELAAFKPDVRLKTWSFHVWAMARFPNKWLKFARNWPSGKKPFPEQVEETAQKIFGIPLSEVEAQWRKWASGRGVTAAATGYGPPLLPEFPNDDELDGLERLNKVRSVVSCFQEFDKEEGDDKKKKKTSSKDRKVDKDGWAKGMMACELDSEATAACKDHAVFLSMHKDHWKWPEAHEEDPAKDGFSPRGMRAGLRSVIVMSEGQLDAANSIDQWIGTVYHRFPLLEYNIKRFGLAHAAGPEGEVVVLDMGSLEEPLNQEWEREFAFVAWPPNGMKNVPRQFAYTEHPNPLADVGIDFDGQKNTGYPVSLQFTRLIMQQTGDCSMALYEAKKRGAKYEAGEEVPCWLHTPDNPLLKRMVLRDVVFVIPKEVLKSNQAYKAVVTLTLAGGQRKFEWAFTTGAQKQGLGKLK